MDGPHGQPGSNGKVRAPVRSAWPPRDAATRGLLLASETAFAAWVAVAVLAIGLGLVVAKHAQAWGRSPLHPAALLGSGAMLAGVALALLAAGRHGQLRALLAASGRPGAVAGLAVGLVVVLAWAALASVWAVGPEPPSGPAR